MLHLQQKKPAKNVKFSFLKVKIWNQQKFKQKCKITLKRKIILGNYFNLLKQHTGKNVLK